MDGQFEQAVDAIFLLTHRAVFYIFAKYKQTQPNRDLSNSPITSILNHKEYCRELAQPAQPSPIDLYFVFFQNSVFRIFSKFRMLYFSKFKTMGSSPPLPSPALPYPA